MKEGEIVDFGNTTEVYNRKKDLYCASLFDDVSEIDSNGEKQLFYPHEFEIVNHSEIVVDVKRNYFKGNHFLIEGEFLGKAIFFNSNEKIEPKSKVYIKKKSRN
jgi:ABC-type oligopeptide transport system ATPase subunit